MDPKLIEEARKKVEAKKEFFGHLTTFLLVGVILFLVNIFRQPWDIWFYKPLIPWSVGLIIHYILVFGLPGTEIMGKDWEERELEKEISRLKNERSEEEERLDLKELRKEKLKKENWDDQDLV